MVSVAHSRLKKLYGQEQEQEATGRELDLPPYIPADVIKEGRLDIKALKRVKKYRLVTYPNKYPDFASKRIKVMKISK